MDLFSMKKEINAGKVHSKIPWLNGSNNYGGGYLVFLAHAEIEERIFQKDEVYTIFYSRGYHN